MARRNNVGAAIGGVIVSYAIFWSFMMFLATKLFEYSLATIFAKDVPWYGDVLGAVLLNGLNLPIAVICFIANLAGAPSPWFGG